MLQDLICVGCGVLIGIGLVFLEMGRISKGYGDKLGASCAPVVASLFFILAVVLLSLL